MSGSVLRRSALALFAVLCGCRSQGTSTNQSAATGAAPPSIATAGASAAPRDASIVLDAERPDAAAHAAYVQALARGRSATTGKRWAEAIAAFDDALRAQPNDARALSERGYAELLSGDREKATADFEAARFTHDRALAAQVWFNLGLASERDGGVGDDALLDYWFANRLAPSAAAQAKLGGREVCPLRIDRTVRPATKHATWLAAVKALGASGRCVAPTSEAAAKALAGPPLMTPQGTFHVLRSGQLQLDDCIINDTAVVQVQGADVWLYPSLGPGTFVFMLEAQPDVVLASLGPLVRATSALGVPDEVTTCTSPARPSEVFDCKGDPDEVATGIAHPRRDTEYTDTFYDGAAHSVIVSTVDAASGRFPDLADGGARRIDFRVDGGALRPTGFGCSTPIAALNSTGQSPKLPVP